MSEMNRVQGICEEKFEPLKKILENNLKTGVDVGASLAINIEGKFVVDLWGGYANAEQTILWEKDTIVNVFSTTKIMAALCIHILADRGQIEYDTPVAEYWPEFAQNGKDKIPVKYILSHSSGLSGWDQKIQVEDFYDWDKVTGLLARQKPWWEPGTRSGYHAITFGYLLGELVRRITGKSLGTFFKDEVASPLNADFHIGFGEELDHRVADLIPPPSPNLITNILFKIINTIFKKSVLVKTVSSMVLDIEKVNQRDWRAAEIPAANGHGNARSIGKIGAMLANGGEVNGVRILSKKVIDKSIEEQITSKDFLFRAPIRFGLGWGLINDFVKEKLDINPGQNSFFWGGYGGSICLIDPDLKTCIAFAMNKLNPDILGDARLQKIIRTYGNIIY